MREEKKYNLLGEDRLTGISREMKKRKSCYYTCRKKIDTYLRFVERRKYRMCVERV